LIRPVPTDLSSWLDVERGRPVGGATSTISLGRTGRAGLQQEIEELLSDLRGSRPVKKLFWELLGYDRRDEAFSVGGMSPELRSSVLEASLLASHDKFHVYQMALTGENLTHPVIARLYRWLRRKHQFVALLVSNAGQTEWHLAYQPDDPRSVNRRGRVSTISLAHGDQNPRRLARSLVDLKVTVHGLPLPFRGW